MRRPTLGSIAVAPLAFLWAAPALAVSLDWKIRSIYVKPQPMVEGPLTIGCQWRATVDHWFKWTKPVQWSGMFLVDGQSVDTFNVLYDPNNHIYMPPQDQDASTPIEAVFGGYQDYAGTATNEFNGTAEHTVTLTAGSHKVGCAIAVAGETGEASDRKGNNTKVVTIEVQPINKLSPAEFPTYKPPSTGRIGDRDKAPQSAVKNVSLPRPKLTMSVNSPTYDASCKDPYNIANVKVTVHADLPLGANRGWVDVSEPTKASLSGKAELPAIGAGWSVPITVTLATAVPPSSLIGSHSLLILLQPKSGPGGSPAFDPPANAEWVTLSFPADYCPSAKVIPGPTRVSIPNQPAGGERVRAATPVIPALRLPPPGQPGITPGGRGPLASQSNPADGRALSVQASAAKPYEFHPAEKLMLQDGRALMKQGATLVLLDRKGNLQKSYPPGAEVFVGVAGDVIIRSGQIREPLGILKRN